MVESMCLPTQVTIPLEPTKSEVAISPQLVLELVAGLVESSEPANLDVGTSSSGMPVPVPVLLIVIVIAAADAAELVPVM